MSIKKIVWTENKVNNFIKQGRGQGEGAQYVLWIKVGDGFGYGLLQHYRLWCV